MRLHWKMLLLGLVVISVPALLLVPSLVSPQTARANPDSSCQLTWQPAQLPNVDSALVSLHSVSVIADNDAWAVGEWGDSGAERSLILHWDGNIWSDSPLTYVNRAYPPLKGVDAIAPDNVWAVGDNIVLHWDGRLWQKVNLPFPYSNDFRTVAAVAADDVWIAGLGPSPLGGVAFAAHWDGKEWSAAPLPHNLYAYSYITKLYAVASNDIWAVGMRTAGNDHHRYFILHWDGSSWSESKPPHPTKGTLFGIYALNAHDAWAVGYSGIGYTNAMKMFVLHWDGSAWSVAPAPEGDLQYPALTDVIAFGTDDIWAVGREGYYHSLVAHWDGKSWNTTLYDEPSGLNALDAASPNKMWAVSSRQYLGDHDLVKTLEWSGTTWSPHAVPAVGSANYTFGGVHASTANDVWAVGTTEGKTLIEHWDGSAWKIFDSPTLNRRTGSLTSVDGASANDVWAVGDEIFHWDGTAWTVVPDPVEQGIAHHLNAMDVIATNDIWAVGWYRDDTEDKSLVIHWDGTTWSRVPVSDTGAGLKSVSASASNDVWAVGDGVFRWYASAWHKVSDITGNSILALAPTDVWVGGFWHWNGVEWTKFLPQNYFESSDVTGMAAVAADNIYAVGSFTDLYATSALSQHWDGSEWRGIVTPNGSERISVLSAVSMLSAEEGWAVGTTFDPPVPSFGVILHATKPFIEPLPIPPAPHPPKLRSPRDGAVVKNLRQTLAWSDIHPAFAYDVELSSRLGIEYHRSFGSRWKRDITYVLAPDYDYQWRVRSCIYQKVGYICGDWSNAWRFTVHEK